MGRRRAVVEHDPDWLDWISDPETRHIAVAPKPVEKIEEARQTMMFRRRRAVRAATLSVAMGTISLLIYQVRRPRVGIVFFFTVFLIALGVAGVVGNLKINPKLVFLHTCIGTALAFAIALNILIAAIMEEDRDAGPIPLPVMLGVMLIPYSTVGVCCLYSSYFAWSVLYLNDLIDEAEDETSSDPEEPEIAGHAVDNYSNNAVYSNNAGNSTMCTICMARRKDTVIVPCGHKAVCQECAETLTSSRGSQNRCPLCRMPIQQVVRVFE
eukprot:TRINITY_DN27258_c0_g1_i1.p1 TRINITY_DN27258_c0_g1~~TRINITY_DN27258_c0_g1_i1.p1  ORF type:complete len:268 (-),score=32.46 TRINITY_DN27258_c0_g1_i1:117-920(-)